MNKVCNNCGKPETPLTCACGKSIEKGGKLYVLRNRMNGKEIEVGECCIGHFLGD